MARLTWKSALCAAALSCAALPLGSHPHIFVDTTLTFKQNAKGELTQVEVTWVYDDFFTLLILEDMGLDPDGDGALTEQEFQKLWAFDLKNWYPGFEGDLYLNASDGEKVTLGKPRATKIDMKDGRIIAGHRRKIPNVAPEGIEIQQYDPTFYVAYSLTGGVHFEKGCTAEVSEADMEAATAARDNALSEALADQGVDIFEFVELGIHYADRIKVTCENSS